MRAAASIWRREIRVSGHRRHHSGALSLSLPLAGSGLGPAGPPAARSIGKDDTICSDLVKGTAARQRRGHAARHDRQLERARAGLETLLGNTRRRPSRHLGRHLGNLARDERKSSAECYWQAVLLPCRRAVRGPVERLPFDRAAANHGEGA